jgi:hypothetical protein
MHSPSEVLCPFSIFVIKTTAIRLWHLAHITIDHFPLLGIAICGGVNSPALYMIAYFGVVVKGKFEQAGENGNAEK